MFNRYHIKILIICAIHLLLCLSSAYGTIHQVSSTAGDNTTNGALREIIDNDVVAGDTIYFGSIAPGSTITLDDDAVIDVSRLYIDGQANNITLDGGNSTRMFYIDEDADSVIIKNLTMTNGSEPDGAAIKLNDNIADDIADGVQILNCTFDNNNSSDNGGAIYAAPKAITGNKITIKNCFFDQNTAADDAAALYIEGLDALIDSCDFSNNVAGLQGGTMKLEFQTSRVTNCTFTDNEATGTGGAICIAHDNDTTIIQNCVFDGNHVNVFGGGPVRGLGGAIGHFSTNNGTVFIYNSVFKNNTADGNNNTRAGGGAIGLRPDDNVEHIIMNCLFHNNSAQGRGGAIHTSGSLDNLSIINCTFAENESDTDNDGGSSGGGFYGKATNTVTNCIFWNNTNGSGSDDNIDGPTPTYSAFPGGNPADNNIDLTTDPFCGATCDYYYSLNTTTACRDAGNNSGIPADIVDVDSDNNIDEDVQLDIIFEPRIQNGTVNMGCYEEIFGITIDSVSRDEGDAGTTDFEFTVTIANTLDIPFTVDYSITPSTATTGTDYNSISGTLNMAAGTTKDTITVEVIGELLFEADETFRVELSNNLYGTFTDSIGLGTIINDDTLTAGTIDTNQTICYGSVAAELTEDIAAQGASSYGWQYSLDSINWATMDSTRREGLYPGALTDTTYFRRIAYNPYDTLYSNAVKINVYDTLIGGNISSNQTICFNAQPATFNSTIDARGGDGITYQWRRRQGSENGWTDIGGNTNTLTDATALTDTTWYTRLAISATCGTVSTDTLTVLVDSTAPNITMPGDETVECYADTSAPYATYAAFLADGGAASDSVMLDTNTFTHVSSVSSGTSCPETITRTYQIEDTCGNFVQDTQLIIINDITPPTLSSQNDTIYLDASGNASTTTTAIDDGSSDNCGIDTLYLSQYDFTCANTGDNTIKLYAIDTCGNIDSINTTVRVLDTISPTASCIDITIYLNALGNATIDTTFINNGSSDACGIDTLWLSMYDFDCSNVGNNNVTLYAQDNNGNIDSCMALVEVRDTTLPDLTCNNDTTIYFPIDSCSYTLDDFRPLTGRYDNCGIDTLIQKPLAGNNYSNDSTQINVWIIATDNNGNIDSCDFWITLRDTLPPKIICENDTVVCYDEGTDSAYISLGQPTILDNCGYLYWNTYNNTMDASDHYPVGKTLVRWWVNDSSGSSDQCVQYITVKKPTISTIADQHIGGCTDTLELRTTVSADFPYSFNWQPDNSSLNNINQQSPVLTNPVEDTTIRYIVTITDSNNCSNYDTVDIRTDLQPVVSSIPDTTMSSCYDSIRLASTAIGNNLSYSWTNGSYLDDTAALSPVLTNTYQSENLEFVVTAQDTFGCYDKDTVYVSVTDVLNATIHHLTNNYVGGYDVQCHDSSDARLIVTVAGGDSPYQYNWDVPAQNQEDSIAYNLSAGNYGVTITDRQGCTDTSSTAVTEPPEMQLEINHTNVTCPGDANGTAEATAEGGQAGYSPDPLDYTYIWSNGSKSYIADSLSGGTYSLTVSDSNDCRIADTVSISEPEPIKIDYSLKIPECINSQDGAIDLTVTNGVYDQIIWSNNSIGEDLNEITAGTYIVTIIYNNVCEYIDSFNLGYQNEICFEIPNAFSPNADGSNDTWEIDNLTEMFPNCVVTIYDRWGTMIYKNKGYAEAWDGTYKGKKLPMDSYHYIIELNDPKQLSFTGQVTIIR